MRKLRIKDLKDNQVTFYYQEFDRKDDATDENGDLTGEKINIYKPVVKAKARISPNMGEVKENPFGTDIKYDKVIATVQGLHINKNTKLFIDTVPVIAADGTTTTKPDYVVTGIESDLHEHLWAISRVGGA